MMKAEPGSDGKLVVIYTGGMGKLSDIRKMGSKFENMYVGYSKAIAFYPVPAVARAMVQAAGWWLPQRVKDKLHVCADEKQLCQALAMDRSMLPAHLTVEAQNALKAQMQEAPGNGWTSEDEQGNTVQAQIESLNAGEAMEVMFGIPTGIMAVSWKAEVDAGLDAGLGMLYVDPQGQETQIHASAIFQGSIQCPSPFPIPGRQGGHMKFDFDNSHAWVKGKQICSTVTLYA